MAHQVREITIRFVVDDDGPAMDAIEEALFEGSAHWPDWLVGMVAVSEESRPATGEEAKSMAWCPDCNPPVGGE